MALNKEISSILLLVVIGFAIYCLCNTKSISGMANVAPYQEEESESLIIESEEPEQKTASEASEESEEPATPESIVSETVKSASEVEPNDDVDTTVSETDIKSILKTSCGPNLPGADSSQIPSANTVSSFSQNTQGANLKNAYANPLPQGTSTDKINFKQNDKKYNAKDYLPDATALKNIPKDKRFEGDFTSAKYKLEGESSLIPIQQFTIGAESGTSGSHKGSWWGLRGVAGVTNPRVNVGIWNNSTRVPDNNRKPIGC